MRLRFDRSVPTLGPDVHWDVVFQDFAHEAIDGSTGAHDEPHKVRAALILLQHPLDAFHPVP